MPVLPFQRFQRVVEEAGWTVTLQSDASKQPILLTVQRDRTILQLRVYIWNITRGGGGPGVRPSSEYRIQKMGNAPLELGNGRLTLLLGWFEPYEVLVAWNPATHATAKHSASIQVPIFRLVEAQQRGIAIHPRDEPLENVVAFTADQISFYLEQAPIIHSRKIADVTSVLTELDTQQIESETGTFDRNMLAPPVAPVPSAGTLRERRRIASKTTSWVRSRTFPRAVVWAYDYNCAVCGIGLGLIIAAHIVPVADPKTKEHPSNGLALCPLHHDAYDDGIFGVAEDFTMIPNPTKINDLKHKHLEGGLDVFLSITPIGEAIRLPDYVPYRPDPELLRYSLALRGFR